MTVPDESRFEADPAVVLGEAPALPEGWSVGVPADPAVDGGDDVRRLTALLRAHETAGRGWAGSGPDDVRHAVSSEAAATRAHVVLRDDTGAARAWGGVHDRAGGRMVLTHVVDHDLDAPRAEACARVLLAWAEGQAVRVGAARGLEAQQIDTGAHTGDDRQRAWLATAGFAHVRTWWQMSRPVTADDVGLVADPAGWQAGGVVVRRVAHAPDGSPVEADLRAVHDVLEGAFVDHFNYFEETFDELVHRLRLEPGHRWDHWWLAELVDEGRTEPEPVGCLVGEAQAGGEGPDGSYVAYLGVLAAARGRGVAKGLLHTVVADAAARGRDRVGLEVDAGSSTHAEELYLSLGWRTRWTTESWHRDVPVTTPARP